MVVGEGVVDGHVFEEPADVGVEEAFDFFVVELGVDEDGADVSFDYVGQALGCGRLASYFAKLEVFVP